MSSRSHSHYSKLLLFISLVAFSAQITQAVPYTFHFSDASNSQLENMLVTLLVTTPDKTTYAETRTISQEAKLIMDLPPEEYSVLAIGDIFLTSGRDYLGTTTLRKNDNEATILLIPAATLHVTILDESENLASFTAFHLECNNPIPVDLKNQTDFFGFIAFNVLPAGKCTILASKQGSSAATTIDLKQGDFYTLKLQLEKPANNKYILLILLIIVLIIAALVAFWITTKKQTPLSQSQKITLSKRTEDILTTLKPKEAEIIQHLLLHNNAGLQSHLMHELNIPKTTLSRILEGLQNKKIVNCEPQGKNKKVTLTPWFLGKEEK